MTKRTVTLVRPTAEQNNRRYDDKLERYVGESFGRGERIIMVDGVRWGRTIVTMHGCHGTTHTFVQEAGHVLEERPGTRYPGEIAVRSIKQRKWLDEPWQPTEERVLAKVRELVETGRLKHPDVVRAAHKRAEATYRQRAAEAEAKREAELRAKAAEALRVNDPTGEMVDRVVAAMKWASGEDN